MKPPSAVTTCTAKTRLLEEGAVRNQRAHRREHRRRRRVAAQRLRQPRQADRHPVAAALPNGAALLEFLQQAGARLKTQITLLMQLA